MGGEIVEQGWIVSVPWGIVPGGEPTAAQGGEEKECHENPIIGILLDQQVQDWWPTRVVEEYIQFDAGGCQRVDVFYLLGSQGRTAKNTSQFIKVKVEVL